MSIKKSIKNVKKGFTLIELLVVIAIIGILSGVVLASLNTARQRARDSQRVSDVRQVALALALYFDSNGAYPTHQADNAIPDQLFPPTGSFLPIEPLNPAGSANAYEYNSAGTAVFCVGVQLESAAIPRNNVGSCVTQLNAAGIGAASSINYAVSQ